MGSLLVRLSDRSRAAGSWPRLASLTLVAVLAGALLVGERGLAQTREYSAYADARKPVISFLFSQDENVEAFRGEFGLSEEQVASALAIARRETATLEEEHAESEEIVEAGQSLAPSEVEEKISASDYEEEVEATVAETKSGIEALLPDDRAADFGTWVDGRWEREQEELYAEGDAKRGSRGFGCRTVYASYYDDTPHKKGSTYQVALPHQRIKFDGGYKVGVRHDGKSARVPVKEAGPWNTRDNYWARRKNRDMWRDLRRCKPEAEAAYFNNYNKGEDQYGREVLNPAGIDLTLRAASAMGAGKELKRKGLIRVTVRFPWVRE